LPWNAASIATTYLDGLLKRAHPAKEQLSLFVVNLETELVPSLRSYSLLQGQ